VREDRIAISKHTTADRLAVPGAQAAELERTITWLAAEEGRITQEQYYLVSDATWPGLLASCYVIPNDCVHTAYATWQMLFGQPVWYLVDRILDDASRARTATALTELATRLPADATDTLAVVTPGATRPGISGANADDDTVATLVAGIEDLAATLSLPIVAIGNVRDEPDCAVLHRVLGERGYVAVTTGADAVLDVPAGDLDSYFAGFRANRRKIMRKERNRFVATGPTVAVSGSDGLTPDLVDLQLSRYTRYGHHADATAVLDRFRRAATIPGLRVLRADGVAGPLGFVGFYEDGPRRRIVTRLGAFARDDTACYFNLAFYELISYAANAGGFRIHYGDSTYGAKTARGCRLVRLRTYFRAADPNVQRSIARAGQIRTYLEEEQLSRANHTGRDPR
jgi:hypothetical protein